MLSKGKMRTRIATDRVMLDRSVPIPACKASFGVMPIQVIMSVSVPVLAIRQPGTTLKQRPGVLDPEIFGVSASWRTCLT